MGPFFNQKWLKKGTLFIPRVLLGLVPRSDFDLGVFGLGQGVTL